MGVDNGWIRFDQFRVPYDALLNRFASISDEGVYSSPIEKDSKRFAFMIGTLSSARIFIANVSNITAFGALQVATRYAASRRQFGGTLPSENKKEEIVESKLIDYPMH